MFLTFNITVNNSCDFICIFLVEKRPSVVSLTRSSTLVWNFPDRQQLCLCISYFLHAHIRVWGMVHQSSCTMLVSIYM